MIFIKSVKKEKCQTECGTKVNQTPCQHCKLLLRYIQWRNLDRFSIWMWTRSKFNFRHIQMHLNKIQLQQTHYIEYLYENVNIGHVDFTPHTEHSCERMQCKIVHSLPMESWMEKAIISPSIPLPTYYACLSTKNGINNRITHAQPHWHPLCISQLHNNTQNDLVRARKQFHFIHHTIRFRVFV